jgi:hypothetical protein
MESKKGRNMCAQKYDKKAIGWGKVDRRGEEKPARLYSASSVSFACIFADAVITNKPILRGAQNFVLCRTICHRNTHTERSGKMG